MKNIEYLKNQLEVCKQMAKESNIEIGKIYEIKINTRAKKRWGLCSCFKDGFIIEISSTLLQDDVSESALMDTLMHEVLHTVKGCMNHGKKWKECAKIINLKYGLNIKTTTSAAEKNISDTEEYNYIIACPKCGHQWKYIRMSRCVKHPERFRHTGCCDEGLIRIL